MPSQHINPTKSMEVVEIRLQVASLSKSNFPKRQVTNIYKKPGPFLVIKTGKLV